MSTASILTQIYNGLEAMNVTYTNKSSQSVTPTVYDLDEIPASVQTAHLPCRILLPLGTSTLTVEHGAGINAGWIITDLFLLETAARDAGVYIQAPVLTRYVEAYAEALGKKFQFLYNESTLTLTISASVDMGIFEYPTGSGVYFYGVRNVITVEEIF